MLKMNRLGTCGAIVGILAGIAGLGTGVAVDILVNGRPTLISAIVVIAGLLMGLLFAVIFGSLFGANRLLKTGAAAQATVLEVWDTGVTVNQNAIQVGLKLRVSPPDGPPYETSARTFVSRLNPGVYRPGMLLNVRYDPKNPNKVAVEGWGGTGNPMAEQVIQSYMSSTGQGPASPQVISNLGQVSPEAQQLLRSVLADKDRDGVPDVFQQAGAPGGVQVIDLRAGRGQQSDPAARLQKLTEMRQAGLITEQEYQEKKAEILKAL